MDGKPRKYRKSETSVATVSQEATPTPTLELCQRTVCKKIGFSWNVVILSIARYAAHCAALSCGAMIVAGTRALTLAGMEEEEGGRKKTGFGHLLTRTGRRIAVASCK
jgi:hypothetical protein